MLCSNCGKQVSFVGKVCPYCHQDKSKDQLLQTMCGIFGIIGLVIGYGTAGFLGAVIGLLAGVVIGYVFVKSQKDEGPKGPTPE